MNKFAVACLFIFGVGFAGQQAAPSDEIVIEHNDPTGCNCGKGKGGK